MISIIIATYNEAKTIEKTLKDLLQTVDIEIIVVDGGSTDNTVKIVKKSPVKLIDADKNRAMQMNKGAHLTKGDILLFLHADCTLEKGALDEIERCIKSGFIGGCLSQSIVCDRRIYRSIEASGNLRAKISRIFYGDQAIFVKKDIFFNLGGFDDVDLFDDVLFSKKLRNAGRTCVLDKKVYVLPRRWQRQGIVKTTAINWLISVSFMLGVSPRVLKKLYSDIR